MTETLVGVSPPESEEPPVRPAAEELEAARELVRQARAHGLALTGPNGLLKALTKTVIETALDEEMSEHLGYDKHAPEGRIATAAAIRRTMLERRGRLGPVVCGGVFIRSLLFVTTGVVS